MKPPYAIGSVPSLSGHAIAYRWRLLPRVRRHRASKSQGSSERVPPWQVTLDQIICASLSHTHYWYEVGMLKVPPAYGLESGVTTEGLSSLVLYYDHTNRITRNTQLLYMLLCSNWLPYSDIPEISHNMTTITFPLNYTKGL